MNGRVIWIMFDLIFDHTINREKFKGVGILETPIKQKNIMQRITSFLFITLHKVHLWDGHNIYEMTCDFENIGVYRKEITFHCSIDVHLIIRNGREF